MVHCLWKRSPLLAQVGRIRVRLYGTIKENSLITVKSCKLLRNSTFPEYVGSPHSKLHGMIWRQPLQNVYVVKKPWNDDVRQAMYQFIRHLHDQYPAVNVIVSEDVVDELIDETQEQGIRISELGPGSGPSPGLDVAGATETHTKPLKGKITLYTGSVEDVVNKTDVIVTLGGDGTILRAVSTFLNACVPPVLSFALGTLGFLLPFDFSKFATTFKMVYESRAKVLHRSRLECHVVRKVPEMSDSESSLKKKQIQQWKRQQENHSLSMVHAMNDIVLHRGGQPNLSSMDIFIDNTHLTTTTADGLVFATPTGSTAYSLSSGGSIVHPLVQCILLSPICPRSLSFRPLILPSISHVMIKMLEKNRNTSIKLSIDGIPQQDLHPGDEIHVVSENGTIYPQGNYAHLPAGIPTVKNNENMKPVPDTKALHHKGIWCVARSETDWTSDINELLGFNSSFKQNSRKE